jgi:hypothetical protein
MTRGFHFWTGYVNFLDHGGTYIRQVGPRRFHFLGLVNMDEACGSDNDGQPRYVVELSEVDLDAIAAETQRGAYNSCGSGISESNDQAKRDAEMAGMCHSYGAKAPLHSVSTDNAHKGIRECRAESYLSLALLEHADTWVAEHAADKARKGGL